MKQYKIHKPVLCTWVDSAGVTPGWSHPQDIRPIGVPEMTINTVGYIVKQTKHVLNIAQSYRAATNNVCECVMGVLAIPVVAIKKIKVL